MRGARGMHDRHLEGFVRVVERGSFSKAAADLFVSPNALIKQVNLLERDVGVELLSRTNRGIKPTPAGEYLYEKAKAFIAESQKATEEARRIGSAETHVIRLATSLLRPTRKIAAWWKDIEVDHPTLKLTIVSIPDEFEQWQKYFLELGNEIDVAAAIKPGEGWSWFKKCRVRDIYTTPVVCAVPQGHRLCKKERLTFADLHDEKVLLGPPNTTPAYDLVRARIVSEHPRIRLAECAPYDVGDLNTAAEDGSIVIVCEDWAGAHPFFDFIPLEEGGRVTISLIYPLDCNDAILEFVDAISEQAGKNATEGSIHE